MAVKRCLVLLSLVGLLMLTGAALAQEADPTPTTFDGVMRYLADELDASASSAIRASTQADLTDAMARMMWVHEQIAQSVQPMTDEACAVRAALAQWADFQVRAFQNYPDRTYDYLYHDFRSRFNDLLSNLPNIAANQPYTLLTSAPDVPERTTPTLADDVPLLIVERVADIPGWDSTALRYSPNGHTLLRVGAGASDIIDTDTLTPTSALAGSRMTMDVDFSNEPAVMVAVNPGVGVTTWDANTLEALVSLPASGVITDVAISSDAQYVVGGGTDGFTVWTYTGRRTFLPGATVHALAFSPDNTQLAVSVAGDGETAAGIYLYDTASWTISDQWEPNATAPGAVVHTLIFSADNHTIAVVCSLAGVCLHDTDTGERRYVLPNSSFALDAAFSPNGEMIAIVGGAYLQVYAVETGTMIYRQTLSAANDSYRGVTFSPDGEMIATTNAQGIMLFTMPD